jgi:hypothetical protein
MAGLLYFGEPLQYETAYKTKDGKMHRGSDIRSYSYARYFVRGFGTPEIIPIVKGGVALLGFSVSYTVSDEWLQNKDADFDGMIKQAVREAFGQIAAEKSRSKRLAFLAEFRKETRRGEKTELVHFCGKLPAPCPFSDIHLSSRDTPDVPRGLWSEIYTVREALDDENMKVALSLLGKKGEQRDRDELIEFVFKKGTVEEIVSVLEHVPLDHRRYDELVERVLTGEQTSKTLIGLGTGNLLARRQDRTRARKRMFEEVPPELLFADRRHALRMSADEVNDYGEKLLARDATADGRARFLAIYHMQILSALALRLVENIESAPAEALLALLVEDLMDEELRQKVIGAVSKARDSAIVKMVLVDRRNNRTNRELSKPEIQQIISGFLKNAHDERWFDAITNYGGSAISQTQAQALIKIGLDRKIPEVFRIALVTEWTSDAEAREIMHAFLGFADKYGCIRVLRTLQHLGGRKTDRITEDIRARLNTCAADQVQHLKRRL